MCSCPQSQLLLRALLLPGHQHLFAELLFQLPPLGRRDAPGAPSLCDGVAACSWSSQIGWEKRIWGLHRPSFCLMHRPAWGPMLGHVADPKGPPWFLESRAWKTSRRKHRARSLRPSPRAASNPSSSPHLCLKCSARFCHSVLIFNNKLTLSPCASLTHLSNAPSHPAAWSTQRDCFHPYKKASPTPALSGPGRGIHCVLLESAMTSRWAPRWC